MILWRLDLRFNIKVCKLGSGEMWVGRSGESEVGETVKNNNC